LPQASKSFDRKRIEMRLARREEREMVADRASQ
jgi:hypothetical protein